VLYGESVLCFILCNTEGVFSGVINQFENEEGSHDPRDSVLLDLFFFKIRTYNKAEFLDSFIKT
jgi:hypothetical protein